MGQKEPQLRVIGSHWWWITGKVKRNELDHPR
jgi:hypothetical protein